SLCYLPSVSSVSLWFVKVFLVIGHVCSAGSPLTERGGPAGRPRNSAYRESWRPFHQPRARWKTHGIPGVQCLFLAPAAHQALHGTRSFQRAATVVDSQNERAAIFPDAAP